ncbi:MAG: hypothetical protein RL113_557 [Pseudomonadota bacterium]
MFQQCYCKSGLNFAECCEPLLKVERFPQTPLALMRSRYSGYCLGDVNYLQATTYDHQWSDEELKFIQDWADESFWQHLEIIEAKENIVEFKAYYIYEQTQHLHHERSRFIRLNDTYQYVDGDIYEDKVVFTNNQSCICGSGLKYKRCCLQRIKK